MRFAGLISKSSSLKLSIVMGIDFLWGTLLTGPGRNLLISSLETSDKSANTFINDNVEPMLWWSYGFIYLGQVWWFMRTAKSQQVSKDKLRNARHQWWYCLGLLLTIGLMQRGGLIWFCNPNLPIKALSMLIFILLIDVAVVYWIPSLLMTPKEYLPAVPSWRIIRRKT